jgi:hypothetical protein
VMYLGDCASLGDHLDALSRMTEGEQPVTYQTFRKNVGAENLDRWSKNHGYELHSSRGLTLKKDWHVSYHRSWWYGRRCYYLVWSAFEHVWVRRD